MSGLLEETTWSHLLERISKQRCLPFLGAGASVPAIPPASIIAAAWAKKYNYPGDNPTNLVEVAQFLAVQFGPLTPKEEIVKQLDCVVPPDFSAADEPHGLLADLPLLIYLTTNYDDFMVRALKSRHRDPHRDLCRWWNRAGNYSDPPEDNPCDFQPTLSNPLVFHLHGHTIPESIVVTEDDYLSFIREVTMNRTQLLPTCIELIPRYSPLLFIGYRLADWDFRLLLQTWQGEQIPKLTGTSIAVLKPPGDDDLARRQREYLNKYYAAMKLEIYWGTAREFAAELRDRWNKFESGSA